MLGTGPNREKNSAFKLGHVWIITATEYKTNSFSGLQMVVVKRIAQIREGEREHTLARQPIESNESKWQQFLR